MQELKIEYLPIDDLQPYETNTRRHTDYDVDQIATSIKKFGFDDPIGIWSDHNIIVEGHGRLEAAKRLGLDEAPVIRLDHLTDKERREYAIMHNKTAELSDWDFEALNEELEDLDFDDFDVDFDDLEDGVLDLRGKEGAGFGNLIKNFIIPPFNVFDARQGYWIKRKKAWNELIQDNGDRGDAKSLPGHLGVGNGVSILDPVLAEVVCTWFLPNDGKEHTCIDTFAGDTAFGFVSSYLGNRFTGIELRKEQCDFNNAHTNGKATYICDDGQNVLNHIEKKSTDLLFSCPPYFDLEVYSDLPEDASNQSDYDSFLAILENAFKSGVETLKENRFAVIVVGDIRNDKNGAYYGFPEDIIRIFRESGLYLYNNIKLLTPYGSAAYRASSTFKYRKTVSTYQDVLVFYKGNTKKIKEVFGEVEVADIEGKNMEL